ncbi:MAG: hypothetical protein A3G34_08205 [Candidatus Lindowbacteria bacterium RIFCSPLOWO2_12_FULL_62_27]|nr:MAG: hypothetical protein A3G34_08205 [Candidatus Lindowbacteria bacterium RIFCSPLOWO2_12_FULL_62_27]
MGAASVFGLLLFITNAFPSDTVSVAGLPEMPALAPEKPMRLSGGPDRQLVETFNRADEWLSAGRVVEALEQFGVVAKLAEEPLRSRAMLKFGFAASMLDRPAAQGALTHAAQTPVPDPEGGEIRAFAQRVLQNYEKPQLLTAPLKGASRFFSAGVVRPAARGLWDEINEIEVLRRKGRLTSAIREYRGLAAKYPDHPVILNNMALLLADGVDPREAEQLVRRAFGVAGAENYVEYLYDTLGYVLLRRDQPAESIEHFRRALAMRETAERNLHMAMALDRIGQPDAAVQFRERAGALDVTGELAGRLR